PPLTPALAAATYLADNAAKLPPEFAEDVDIIKRNVQLQARLIDDLLDLTRVTRGKLDLHFERVDAHALIPKTIDIAKADIEKKKLNVSVQLDAEEYHIWADAVRIQQVFWNLINNAVKFTPPSGKIDIRISNDVEKSGVDSQIPRKPIKPLRILLVEDHGDTRQTLSRLLSHFGHQISVADNTKSALEIVQSQKFDVVLSDIGLPDGSGYEVI